MFRKPFVASGRAVLAEDLFEFLQDAILAGDLNPGDRLVEDAVAQATSVSRTPVREALRKLKAAGLVESSGRSFVVATLSSKELHDLWVVMEHLQVLATRMAASHRSEVDLVALRHIVELGRIATKKGDVGAVVRLNREFHGAVDRMSGNEYLTELISSIVVRIETIQDFTSARLREEAQKQHETVLAAIELRDEDAAERAIRAHLHHQFATMAAPRLVGEGRLAGTGS